MVPDVEPPDRTPPPELRRSTRTRKPPERFTFNKKHGYWSSRRVVKTVLTGLLTSTAAAYDYQHIHALMLDHEYGTMENILLNCPSTFKAKKTYDPDTPDIGHALSGPHREEFLEAMDKEIDELEGHETWNVMLRSSLPEGANVLPTTWAFKIKRYPDGRLRKFKARFCVRGDKQIEGVNYNDKYAPVVAWSTVRILMRIALQEG